MFFFQFLFTMTHIIESCRLLAEAAMAIRALTSVIRSIEVPTMMDLQRELNTTFNYITELCWFRF